MGLRIFRQEKLQQVFHDGSFDGLGTRASPLAQPAPPPIVQSAVVELGGDFNGGEEVKCILVVDPAGGGMVTISGVGILNHASDATPTSSAGVIPAAFRPVGGSARSAFNATSLRDVQVTTTGTFFLIYTAAGTSSGVIPSITYNI